MSCVADEPQQQVTSATASTNSSSRSIRPRSIDGEEQGAEASGGVLFAVGHWRRAAASLVLGLERAAQPTIAGHNIISILSIGRVRCHRNRSNGGCTELNIVLFSSHDV